MSAIHNETFDVLCQVGELAGILQDIAAREISESKPITGTAVDMLARMIAGHVERGMNGPAAKGVQDMHTLGGQPAAGAPEDGCETRTERGLDADATWPGGLDLRNLHAALSGAVTCLCGLQHVADGSQIDAEAFEPILATLTPWRDMVLKARDQLEAETD
ncbi:MAG: hypothetical protein ACYCZB_03025 [Acidiphilium sp.]